MEKWWWQQSWEMRENQGYLKTRQTHQIPRGNLEQEWRKISDGNIMHSSHAVKPKSKRALRNPLNYLVAISLQELPKRSHSEPESGSNNPERVLRYRQATNKPGTKALLQRNTWQKQSLKRNARNPITEALSRPFSRARGAKRKAPGRDLCTAVPLHHKHGPLLFDVMPSWHNL